MAETAESLSTLKMEQLKGCTVASSKLKFRANAGLARGKAEWGGGRGGFLFSHDEYCVVANGRGYRRLCLHSTSQALMYDCTVDRGFFILYIVL